MSGHMLACALYCNGDGGLNGLGTTVEWGLLIVAGAGLLIGIGRAVAEGVARAKDPARRREPATDMNPALLDLLSGRPHAAYTYPVSAVTPGGIPVRMSRCCPRGHQSPAQAVRHAQVIGERIARTGR